MLIDLYSVDNVFVCCQVQVPVPARRTRRVCLLSGSSARSCAAYTTCLFAARFKCPFLRGEMDELIDKHEKIEALMASDLDHWLCNCYFEVVKLPRSVAGQ